MGFPSGERPVALIRVSRGRKKPHGNEHAKLQPRAATLTAEAAKRNDARATRPGSRGTCRAAVRSLELVQVVHRLGSLLLNKANALPRVCGVFSRGSFRNGHMVPRRAGLIYILQSLANTLS